MIHRLENRFEEVFRPSDQSNSMTDVYFNVDVRHSIPLCLRDVLEKSANVV